MQEKYFRPNWDDYFMAVARIIATRSTCDRLRAGAVLVKNKRIISTGYNGSPQGLPHCDSEHGHLMEEGHCVRTVHAEHNAILQAAIVPGQDTEGATLYALYSPCIHCCKYIVTAGIKRLVIGKVYRNSKAMDYLQTAGVQVDNYVPDYKWSKMLLEIFENDIEEVQAKEGDVSMQDNTLKEEPKSFNNFGKLY